MNDIYKNIDEYNPNKERKIGYDMVVDMLGKKKLKPIATELFIRSMKIITSLLFFTQSYSEVPKNIRLNSIHHSIMKTPNKRELQQIAIIICQILTLKTLFFVNHS